MITCSLNPDFEKNKIYKHISRTKVIKELSISSRPPIKTSKRVVHPRFPLGLTLYTIKNNTDKTARVMPSIGLLCS